MTVAAPAAPARPVCGAKRRQGEGLCTRPAGWGTTHPGAGPCKLHLGAAPRVAVGAHRQLVEAEARTYLARYGMAQAVEDPVQALSELAGECAALRDYFRGRVMELRESDWTSLTRLEVDQVSALVAAYERALDRCERVLVDLAKLDLGERMVRVSEAQALALGRSLDRALEGAGVAAEQRTATLAILADELSAA